MTEKLYFEFEDEQAERLDKFLVLCLPTLSRSRLQTLIKDGFVKVDETIITKVGFKLERGNKIQVDVPPVVDIGLIAEDIPLEILFENEDVLIINKDAGMVVHPAAGHDQGTLVNAVLAHAPDIEGIGGELRPGVVHRLDKDTSGIIVMAKNDKAHQFLQDQFRLRTVKKSYLAITDGIPPTPVGRVEAPIGRDPSHRKQMAIVPSQRGREAVTAYKILQAFKDHALVEASPLTGRTHQIRLHLAFLGCPIVGDILYGRKKISLPVKRHQLHAFRLEIQLPGEDEMRVFETKKPDDMLRALDYLNQ
jgi:23S rRNA pseudouridine1911/1915/1917 synthase